MLRKDDGTFITPQKKLRFRGDLNLHHFHEIEDIFDEKRRDSFRNGEAQLETPSKKGNTVLKFPVVSSHTFFIIRRRHKIFIIRLCKGRINERIRTGTR